MSRSILSGAVLLGALLVITSGTLAVADRGDEQRGGNPRVIHLVERVADARRSTTEAHRVLVWVTV